MTAMKRRISDQRHDVFRGFVFFDFVTCPCSFRTKRHDNLFVYDDDDDKRKLTAGDWLVGGILQPLYSTSVTL